MKERYKKIHNIKYEEGLNTGTATHIRVYRNGGQNLVGIHPFLMSNLEGILVFSTFLSTAACSGVRSRYWLRLSSFRLRSALSFSAVYKFSVKPAFGIERIVVAAELFDIKVFCVNAKAFQHIFSAVMEQKFRFVLAQVSVLIL